MTSFQVDGSTVLPPGIEEQARRRRRQPASRPISCCAAPPTLRACRRACAPPPQVLAEAKKSKYTTVRVLAAAKNIIEAFYQERGLTFGTISHFDGMETGQVIAHIIEGEITRVNLVYVDNEGRTSPFGSTNPRVVSRELPFKSGMLYNVEDAKKALRDIFQLQLFDNVQARVFGAGFGAACRAACAALPRVAAPSRGRNQPCPNPPPTRPARWCPSRTGRTSRRWRWTSCSRSGR